MSRSRTLPEYGTEYLDLTPDTEHLGIPTRPIVLLGTMVQGVRAMIRNIISTGSRGEFFTFLSHGDSKTGCACTLQTPVKRNNAHYGRLCRRGAHTLQDCLTPT